jgi:hypothetical protein
MIKSGKNDIKIQILNFINITKANVPKIFNKVWPDIILANNRIAKLKTRVMYEIISIKIMNGIIRKGVPDGRNKKTNLSLYKQTAIILKAMKKINAKVKVTLKWLITLKLYGNIPLILLINKNKNDKKNAGK